MFWYKKYFAFIYLLFLLVGCSTLDSTLDYMGFKEKEKKLAGKRLDIIKINKDLSVDEQAKKESLNLSKQIFNLSWNQIGNLSTHNTENYLINNDPNFIGKEELEMEKELIIKYTLNQ